MSKWRTAKHDDLTVRSMLGRLLFTADDYLKKSPYAQVEKRIAYYLVS